MKAVLDESAPNRLALALQSGGHDVSTFPREWKGAKNGKLLGLVEASHFDCLLTCNKNLLFQQAISHRLLALVVLPRQRFEDLQPLLEEIGRALLEVHHGETVVIRMPSDG